MFIARAEGYLAHGSSGENGKGYHWSMGLKLGVAVVVLSN